MLKRYVIFVMLAMMSVTIANAQSKRQLQKLEPFVKAGGLVFIDQTASITSATEMTVQQFFAYRDSQLAKKSFVELDRPVFDFSRATPAIWENSLLTIQPNGNFSKTVKIGIRQDFTVSFVSLDENEVVVEVTANDQKFDKIRLKKDFITVLPIVLNKNDNKIKGFLAIQAHDFGLKRIPCSIEDIVNDAINKDKAKLCS